jgi:hypothetical protein
VSNSYSFFIFAAGLKNLSKAVLFLRLRLLSRLLHDPLGLKELFVLRQGRYLLRRHLREVKKNCIARK